MSFFSFVSRCCRARALAQFRRLLKFLGNSAIYGKFFAARHLQETFLTLSRHSNDYLTLNLRILVHFNYILWQFVGCGRCFCDKIFLF